MIRRIAITVFISASCFGVGLRDYDSRYPDTDIVFQTMIGMDAGWTPPVLTAPSLSDAQVKWIKPDNTYTNAKAPAIGFFNQAGTYRIRCGDWSRISGLSFYAGGDVLTRQYLTNVVYSPQAMWRLKTLTTMLNMYRQQTNFPKRISDWPISLMSNNTSLDSTFLNCSGLTGAIPDISTMTNNTSLDATFFQCTGLTGAIPDISTMINNTSLGFTFYNCIGLTGAIPNISTMINNTELGYTFVNCSGLTGAIPDISTMPNNTWLGFTFYNCTGLTGTVESIFSNTNNLSKIRTSVNCFYNVSKLTGNGMWFVNAQKAASYTVGTNSNDSSYHTFYGCTNLSDWATIPNDYK